MVIDYPKAIYIMEFKHSPNDKDLSKGMLGSTQRQEISPAIYLAAEGYCWNWLFFRRGITSNNDL
jgi:hypothetical protein